jgi:hypothetical protein
MALASQLPSISVERDEAALENSASSTDLQDPDSGSEKEFLVFCGSLEL